MLQEAPIVVGEVAIPSCMHASRSSINTSPYLTLITESLIESTILRIRSWVCFHLICLSKALCFDYQTQGLRLNIVCTITKKLKVGSEEGQIFKCSLHTNGLNLEDEVRLFGKLLSCRVR